MPKVYVDGQSGTTGLQILERLENRDDITLLKIDEDKRHDENERKKFLNEADLVFLCLPDQAAIEAVSLIENDHTKVIDASTAHRTTWTYGFPELSDGHKKEIEDARFLANPGCHATGLISVVYPLVQSGILSKEEVIHCFSLTGYSGGGKKMISSYEVDKNEEMEAPGLYGLTMKHKHIPEMQLVCGLTKKPLFTPIVDDYYKGMVTSIQIEANASVVHDIYQKWYANTPLIHVKDLNSETTLYANTMAGYDDLEIIVSGNEEQTLISARFDNLGKGASGAAVENMNLMLGFEQYKGLHLKKG